MADTVTATESKGDETAVKSKQVEKTDEEAKKINGDAANGKEKTEGNGSANGDSALDPEAAKKATKRQLEYYFGDHNLPRDKFLLATIKESEEGWISVETMLKFQRLAQISTDKALILESLRGSELLEVDEEKQLIRRLPSLSIPEVTEEWKKANIQKTVYCKGFEKEKTTLDDLIKFFESFDNVINVMKRTYNSPQNKKEKLFKGSVFVTFKTREDAEKFLKVESVKNPEGEELIRKWQRDYFDEKDKELEERRATRKDRKNQNKNAKEALAKAEASQENSAEGESKDNNEDETALPTGAVLCLKGIKNEETKREDLKDALDSKAGLSKESVAFVYFDKGDKEAKLRLKEEDAAKKVVEKLKEEGEGKLTVNEDELEVSALEGQEETDFLQQCKEDIANHKRKGGQGNRRGHKRRGGGGGGGRGGKRGRAH